MPAFGSTGDPTTGGAVLRVCTARRGGDPVDAVPARRGLGAHRLGDEAGLQVQRQAARDGPDHGGHGEGRQPAREGQGRRRSTRSSARRRAPMTLRLAAGQRPRLLRRRAARRSRRRRTTRRRSSTAAEVAAAGVSAGPPVPDARRSADRYGAPAPSARAAYAGSDGITVTGMASGCCPRATAIFAKP